MMLLDRILQKSKSPYSRADIQDALQRYGPAIRLLTRTNAQGELGAFALLTQIGRASCRERV